MIDIVEHMPTLQDYAGMSDRVVEFGVRDGSGSTTAFLNGRPGELISYDLSSCPKGLAEKAAALGVPFEFRQGNVLTAEVPKCDLLFIDKGIHDWGFWDEFALCAHLSGKADEAVEIGQRILSDKKYPDKEEVRLKRNLDYYLKGQIIKQQKRNLYSYI